MHCASIVPMRTPPVVWMASLNTPESPGAVALWSHVNKGEPLTEHLDEMEGLPDRPRNAGLAAEVGRRHR